MKAYKLPAGSEEIVAKLRELRGDDGSLLAPVQDINGDWFISTQEMEAREFQVYRKKYANIVETFILTDFVPPTPPKAPI